jgi:hypothetical protein
VNILSFYSSQTLIPQVMYADSTINDGEDDDPLLEYHDEDVIPSTGGIII